MTLKSEPSDRNTPAERNTLEASTMRQVALRIVPFLMICYFISFVDRVNLGFAALQMVRDLHLSATVFGLGGGLFLFRISSVKCQATCSCKRSARAAGSPES